MFAEVLPLVREAIQLRYSLVPHLYSLLRRAVAEHEPLLRPTFLDHEHDPRSWEATDDFMLGESLLVASVVEREASASEKSTCPTTAARAGGTGTTVGYGARAGRR